MDAQFAKVWEALKEELYHNPREIVSFHCKTGRTWIHVEVKRLANPLASDTQGFQVSRRSGAIYPCVGRKRWPNPIGAIQDTQVAMRALVGQYG